MEIKTNLIKEEYSDSDGYWIYLLSGYQCDEMHTIHENSKTKAYRKLRDVQICNCKQCVIKLKGEL